MFTCGMSDSGGGKNDRWLNRAKTEHDAEKPGSLCASDVTGTSAEKIPLLMTTPFCPKNYLGESIGGRTERAGRTKNHNHLDQVQ
jgi:hypothetical protein